MRRLLQIWWLQSLTGFRLQDVVWGVMLHSQNTLPDGSKSRVQGYQSVIEVRARFVS